MVHDVFARIDAVKLFSELVSKLRRAQSLSEDRKPGRAYSVDVHHDDSHHQGIVEIITVPIDPVQSPIDL